MWKTELDRKDGTTERFNIDHEKELSDLGGELSGARLPLLCIAWKHEDGLRWFETH